MTDFNTALLALKQKRVIKFDSDVARQLDVAKSAISEYTKGFRSPSASFIQKFNAKYSAYGVTLDHDAKTKFENEKLVYEQKGYNPNPPELNNAGQTVLAKISAANSYAILDLLAELVSEVKKVPIEGVKKRSETKARESLRSIEDSLLSLISS